jgi:CheY-like chemotaxis protein
MMLNSKPILLVEDDYVDVMTVRRVFQDLHVTNELVWTANGEDALAHLRDKGKETPCVILLDLNMPRMNGVEFLQIVKADEALKDIPVVVVTTSGEQQDLTRSAELGAATYVIKCFEYREFREKIKTIESYFAPAQPPERLEPVPL